jgi:predicted HTH domain antitoxin
MSNRYRLPRSGQLLFEQAIVAYLHDGDSSAAAEIAGLPRARFLDMLIDRGIRLLSGPSTVRDDLAYLANVLGSERLRAALAATEQTLLDK